MLKNRKDFLKNIIGIAGIIATSKSPAIIIKSALGSKRNFDILDDKVELPYICNGLVAMWHRDWNSGIVNGYDMSSKSWMDIIGGVRIPLATGMYWSDDGLYVPKTTYSQIPIPTQLSSLGSSFFVNVVFRRASSGNSTPHVISIGEYIYLRIQSGTHWSYNFNQSGNTDVSYKMDSLHSYGFSANNRYINGNFANQHFIGYSTMRGTPDLLDIGFKHRDQGYDVVIGSILVYSRELTSEEIDYNYSVDKVRFGI